MEFVSNANFKGDYGKNINLRELHNNIANSKLYIKPHQLVIKDLKGTLIVFSNGKFRTMGCINELDASFLAASYQMQNEFPSLTLQSYTLKSHIGYHVNLEQLSHYVPCIYEPELFPSLRLREYKPISVNLFSTGKVVVCGLKEPEEMRLILLYLWWLCEPFKLVG